ncbi:uncharacterized protein LOC143247813 [Tachypleus tridentatus]|uniref:uncharacterized protein LOC143247813 n=1 Tax=Tachypleus tridentatus TaxID=6853 RepID=UPI003FD003E9
MKTVVFLIGLVVSVAGQGYVYVNDKQRDIEYNPSSNLFDLSSYVYKPPSEVHQHIPTRGSTPNAKTSSLTGPHISQSHQPPQNLPLRSSGGTLIQTSSELTGLLSPITAGGGSSLEDLYASLEKRVDEYHKKEAKRLQNFVPLTLSHFDGQPQFTNRRLRLIHQQGKAYPQQYTSNQYRTTQYAQLQPQPNTSPQQYTSGKYEEKQFDEHSQQPNYNPQQYTSNQYEQNEPYQYQQQRNIYPQQYTSNQYKQNEPYQYQQQRNIYPQQYTSNQYKQNEPYQYQQQPNIYPQQYIINQQTQTDSQIQQHTHNNEYENTPNFISKGRLQSSILEASQDLPQLSSDDNYPTSATSSDQFQFFGLPPFIINGKEDKSLEELYTEFDGKVLEKEKQQDKVMQMRPKVRGGQRPRYPEVSQKEPDTQQNHYTPQNSPPGNEQTDYTPLFQNQFQDAAKGRSSPFSPQPAKRKRQPQIRRRTRQRQRRMKQETFNTVKEPEDTSRLTLPLPVGSRKTNSQYSSEVSHHYVDLSTDSLPQDLDGDGIPGQAGVDYPTLSSVPQTSFSCRQQPLNGFYADLETSCQVMHLCQAGGVQDSFLCPNGTIFNQEKFSCQWWYKVDCTKSVRFYNLNEALYKVPERPKERRQKQ